MRERERESERRQQFVPLCVRHIYGALLMVGAKKVIVLRKWFNEKQSMAEHSNIQSSYKRVLKKRWQWQGFRFRFSVLYFYIKKIFSRICFRSLFSLFQLEICLQLFLEHFLMHLRCNFRKWKNVLHLILLMLEIIVGFM